MKKRAFERKREKMRENTEVEFIYWHGRKYRVDKVENMRRNSFDRLDKDKLIEISRKGGIASGESRRKKAAKRAERERIAREAMDNFFYAQGVTERELADFREWQEMKRKRTGLNREKIKK